MDLLNDQDNLHSDLHRIQLQHDLQLDLATSPFDNFEFAHHHTPSYNGSYQNSPYSNHSELSYNADEPPFVFDQDPAIREYDPSEYDNPNTSSSLLMFPDADYLSGFDPSVNLSQQQTPDDHRSPHSFDYSSPSSNGGGESDPLRSRASSVSSNRPHTSPRLDVAQTFENLTFQSPSWGNHPLPTPMSPPHKPQSPPQLLIPDVPPPPTINAPAGDGGLMSQTGPQFNIVPATPVSTNVGGQAPFRSSLETLHQEPSGWDQPQQQMTSDDLYHDRQTQAQPQTQPQQSQSHLQQQPYTFPRPAASPTDFLFPAQQRMRSKSDTSLAPPNWDFSGTSAGTLTTTNPATDDNSAATVNMNDILPGADQQYSHHPPNLTHHFTYGPPSSSTGIPSSSGSTATATNNGTNNYLSPHIEPITSLRRAKSDGGSGGRPGHRQSRSEDIRSPTGTSLGLHQQYLPPPSQLSAQFLSPRLTGMSLGVSGGHGGSGHGHYRRASVEGAVRNSPYPSPHASPRRAYDDLPGGHQVDSGMRGLGMDSGLGMGGMGGPMSGMGMHRGNISLSTDMELLGPAAPNTTCNNSVSNGGAGNGGMVLVSKQNVTTTRTNLASQRRRKNRAEFVCQVPGCGSTFTRSFNLKGHMRSHNEERPFQCHWPGCGKGFARQHDCKRHEQLHSNYRPFTCEGCSKPFARMDALNRHLRSEGGADCLKLQVQNGGMGVLNGDNGDGQYTQEQLGPVPKSEVVEGGWNSVLL